MTDREANIGLRLAQFDALFVILVAVGGGSDYISGRDSCCPYDVIVPGRFRLDGFKTLLDGCLAYSRRPGMSPGRQHSLTKECTHV